MSRKKKPDTDTPPHNTHQVLPDAIVKKQSLFGWLRSRFFAGMLIAGPIAITFWLLQWLITFLDDKVRPFLPNVLNPETYTNYAIPGFSLIVAVIMLTIIGAIASNLIGRSLVAMTDRALSRIPIVSNIYTAFRQLFEIIGQDQSANFEEVVLIEYPRPDCWCIGFVASDAREEIAQKLDGRFISVFVPTAPNPTSGFLVHVRPETVKPMSWTVEQGAKMILSAGLVVPPLQDPAEEDMKALPKPPTE